MGGLSKGSACLRSTDNDARGDYFSWMRRLGSYKSKLLVRGPTVTATAIATATERAEKLRTTRLFERCFTISQRCSVIKDRR